MRQAGCACRAWYCRSGRATTTSARCCSIAPRPPPISPTAARATATWKPTAWRCSARRSPTASFGARRSIPCGFRSISTRAPTCAANTSGCVANTASVCWITRSIPTPSRRAPVFSSPRNCRGGAPISHPSWRWRARTSRRFRPTTSSSAWKASSTASATPSRCAPACHRWSGRRWRNRPTSPSSCATASRSCVFPARPMCCRAAASAAFRCSALTPALSCSQSIASATAI